MSLHSYTAYIEFDPDTGLYVGTIPALPGAHTQGATLDELLLNLKEVIVLCLEERGSSAEPLGEDNFVGVQQVTVEV